MFCTVQICAIM